MLISKQRGILQAYVRHYYLRQFTGYTSFIYVFFMPTDIFSEKNVFKKDNICFKVTLGINQMKTERNLKNLDCPKKLD